MFSHQSMQFPRTLCNASIKHFVCSQTASIKIKKASIISDTEVDICYAFIFIAKGCLYVSAFLAERHFPSSRASLEP